MKPGIGAYDRFKELFDRYSEEAGKEQYLIPYFIAAHPGTTDEDMLNLALWLKRNGFRPDQVQAFLPSPMASATAMYHTGYNPLRSLVAREKRVHVVKGLERRRLHKAFLRYHDPHNWPVLREALQRMGRTRSDRRRQAAPRAVVAAGHAVPARRRTQRGSACNRESRSRSTPDCRRCHAVRRSADAALAHTGACCRHRSRGKIERARWDPSPDDSGVVPIGSVLDGRYRVDAVLGKGGMGRVYRGEHTGIGRAVAIKVLHADLGRNKEAAARFQREAIASGRLDHPNIVGVSDFGVLEDGCLYLVMEALEGEALGERLEREKRIPWPEAIEIMRGVLRGPAPRARASGVVHRDIKPDNIFLANKDGERHRQDPRLRHREALRGQRRRSGDDARRASPSARRRICRPSKRSAARSSRRPICTRRASCSTRCSRAARRSRTPIRCRC